MSEWIILYKVGTEIIRGGKVRLYEIGVLEREKTFKLNSRDAMRAHIYKTVIRKSDMGGLCQTKQEAANQYAMEQNRAVRSLEKQLARANERLAAAQEFAESLSDRLKIEDSPCV